MRPGHSFGGGKREAGEVRTLAPHHPFLPGKLLLAPPCNTGCGTYLPLRGSFPNIISSSSHRMTFVFAEVTFKGKHPETEFPGRGRDGRRGRREAFRCKEFKGPSVPPPFHQRGNQSPPVAPQSRTAQDQPIPLALQSRELRPWELRSGS